MEFPLVAGTSLRYDARARSWEAEIRARPNGPMFVPTNWDTNATGWRNITPFRDWLAQPHPVLIGHIAAATKTIRVGSGGVIAARARLARNLYQLELPLLQFIHGAWTDAPGRRARIGNWMGRTSLRFPVDKTPELGYMGWKRLTQATL
jgi:hypothetical protein